MKSLSQNENSVYGLTVQNLTWKNEDFGQDIEQNNEEDD